MEKIKELVKQFSGKNIYIEYYIDNSYRPYSDGVPQYHAICKFDGRTVFDNKLDIKEITWNDFNNLRKYADNIGVLNRRINYYNRYDLTCSFRVI